MGPIDGQMETVQGTPFLRYMTAILFPQGALLGKAVDTVTATADDIAKDIGEADEIPDEIAGGVDLASEQLPSAVGLSFKVTDTATVRCLVWAGRYEQNAESKSGRQRGMSRWRRVPLSTKEEPEMVEIRKGSAPVPVFGGRGSISVRWRTQADGKAVVTVALVNAQHAKESGAPDPSLALFQVGLRCEANEGIEAYPRIGTNHSPSSEEAEIEFLYRAVMSFARGHGAAVAAAARAQGASRADARPPPPSDVSDTVPSDGRASRVRQMPDAKLAASFAGHRGNGAGDRQGWHPRVVRAGTVAGSHDRRWSGPPPRMRPDDRWTSPTRRSRALPLPGRVGPPGRERPSRTTRD